MNKRTSILVLAVIAVTVSGMGIVYSVGQHLATSTGTITITAPLPESGDITVAATIDFGSVTQGQNSLPVLVHVNNTVGRSLVLTVSGTIAGAVTTQICTSTGSYRDNANIPIGGGDIYLRATTTSTAPIAPGSWTITFTAS